MRIGVVSDTHNNLRSVKRIVELFNEARVDRVVHTGDITQVKTVELLSELNAPLYGVYGNNDQGELAGLELCMRKYGFHFIQPPLVLDWAGRQIVVVHDPSLLDELVTNSFDVVLHGHTHLQTLQFEDSRLLFNPGECAGMLQGQNSIGIVDLLALQAEILRFLVLKRRLRHRVLAGPGG